MLNPASQVNEKENGRERKGGGFKQEESSELFGSKRLISVFVCVCVCVCM